MGYIKTGQERDLIIEGGLKLGSILDALVPMVAAGVSTLDIDATAERLIRKEGGRPAFKGYRAGKHDPKFPSAICACINDEIVHGFPLQQKVLQEGDIFTIDVGMQWPVSSGLGEKGNGFFTDTAITLPVGSISDKAAELIAVTKQALDVGIQAITVGGTIADIGAAIEHFVSPRGYGIVRDLVGHGVGHAVHEEPPVPNYHEPSLHSYVIEPGVVIAIEPMITVGGFAVRVDDDQWTIRTADGSLAAHFEHTIVVTDKGAVVATRRPSEK